ncbi:MAG: dihydropteroate synthase [Candidatus Omnitrophica bacterium]|nr:dihydropteroate synthase [Candidatus Omnitrophota bacterium]
MRILQVNHPQDIKQIMRAIGVDPYGIEIMLPKSLTYLIRINSLSNITANILKQEMLSLGADAAVARGALTGKSKKTDCLLMGNLAQFSRLKQKLALQPFGLDKLAGELSGALANYQSERFTLDLGRYKLNLGLRTYLMAILNLTPDSFSGNGLYAAQYAIRNTHDAIRARQDYIVNRVEQLIKDGADIVDVGGESSRPGARPVSVKEELNRTIPAIKALTKKIKVPISIDTYKPEVAKAALDNGAVMVNDITALRNPKMAKVVSRYKAPVVIMHMQGSPRTMQKKPHYLSLIDEIIEYLDRAINRAQAGGIDRDKIIIDPGIGFGKSAEHNLEIIKRLKDFKVLGRPILVGPSRKAFIGKVLNAQPDERVFGTISASLLAAKSGAKILRVHDVKEVKQALRVFEAIESQCIC